MKALSIYVPTRGRLHRENLVTLEQFRVANMQEWVTLVCPLEEVTPWFDRYGDFKILPEPYHIGNIGAKRAWMFDHCQTRYFFMVDDDISFAHQYHDPETNQRATSAVNSDPSRFRYFMTEHLLELFYKYDSVGIGSRLFCNTRPMVMENRKLGWAWGLDKQAKNMRKHLKPVFDRQITMYDDIDWNLTLLEYGHRNIISSYIIAQAGKEAEVPDDGGIGLYRTSESVIEDGNRFMAAHPGVVTESKRYTDFKNRTSNSLSGRFIIHWTRAFEAKFPGGCQYVDN